MMLRLQRYNLHVQYVPGKKLHLADTLSRTFPVQPTATTHFNDVNVLDATAVSPTRLKQFELVTTDDRQLQLLKATVQSGWPDTCKAVDPSLREFFNV